MRIKALKSFTKTQQKIIIKVALCDNIGSGYDVEHNNRLIPPEFRKMTNKRIIVLTDKGYKPNKEIFDKIMGKGILDEVISKLNAQPDMEEIKKDVNNLTLTNKTIDELVSKTQTILKNLKKNN